MTTPMLRRAGILALALGSLLTAGTFASQARADDDHPIVVIDTTAGPITVQLDRTKAPISVDNFLKYVDAKFYDGLVFHRVIEDFMIQGGGFTESGSTLNQKEPLFPAIKNESGNGLSNVRGAIAMARTRALNSATSQFYIMRVDKPALDAGRYCVFGKVTDGLPIVDAIATTPTTVKRMVTPQGADDAPDVPVKAVTIKSIRVKK